MNIQCKYCKKKVVDYYKCEKCVSTFHRSCGIQAKVINKREKVICCATPGETDTSPEEINMGTVKINSDDLKRIIKDQLEEYLSQYKKEITDLKASMQFMSDKFEEQSRAYIELVKTNKALITQNNSNLERLESLDCRVSELEQKEKQNNIVVSGIPRQPNKTVKEIAGQLFQGMGLQVQEEEIEDCYLINTESERKPLVVKFRNHETKKRVFRKRKEIRSIKTNDCGFEGPSTTIYVNDELTKYNMMLFSKMREFKRTANFKYAYATNGRLYLKRADDSRPIRIGSTKDLEKLLPQ